MSMIQVDQLIKQYDKAKTPAVKGVSFAVEEGEFFAFLGPNGAGKTTTISILTTTLAKSSGNVTIAGMILRRKRNRCVTRWGLSSRSPASICSSRRKKISAFMLVCMGCTAIGRPFTSCQRNIKTVSWNSPRL